MRKSIKTFKILICLCILLFVESGCSNIFSTHSAHLGSNQFSTEYSSISLCNYIWPPYGSYNERVDKNPILLFKYNNIDSNFVYTLDEDNLLYNTKESVLSYIVYDKELYEIAKAELLLATNVSDIYQYEYKDYKFFLNLNRKIEQGESIESIKSIEYDFCHLFNMICYNDQKNLLLSIGFSYSPDSLQAKNNDKSTLIYTDIGAFLKEYFYYYDFDAETPSIDVDRLERDYGKQLKR